MRLISKVSKEIRLYRKHTGWRGWYLKGFFFLMVLLSLCHCSYSSQEIRLGQEQISVVFTYVDGLAKKVCITGDFNQWSHHTHCMKKDKDTWSLRLALRPGRYQYLLVIDNQIWKVDPGALLLEESGFGSKNSVLIVE
jgi:1,4-alpha-glucan branching enzyme